MLGQVQPTPFDLYFRLFGIPVRVTPWFWLVGVLLGWGTIQQERFDLLLVWIGCLFFSILVHEMGHALSAQYWGWPPQVFLYHFGGVAMFTPYRDFTMGRSIFISFAGPGAGFILYGIVLAIRFGLEGRGHLIQGEDPGAGGFAIIQLEWINLWWGLVNLLPVLPLDGGRIAQELCQRFRPRDGMALTFKIGIGVGGATAFLLLSQAPALGIGLYPGILFALLALQNFQWYQALRSGYW